MRPAKRDKELEGIRSGVVTNLVTDFKHSDIAILGRQAPKAGDDIHIMPNVGQSQGQRSPEPEVSQSPPEPEVGQSSASGDLDPLYAVPDRSRKSLNRKSGGSHVGSEHSEQEVGQTPQVPNKPDDI